MNSACIMIRTHNEDMERNDCVTAVTDFIPTRPNVLVVKMYWMSWLEKAESVCVCVCVCVFVSAMLSPVCSVLYSVHLTAQSTDHCGDTFTHNIHTYTTRLNENLNRTYVTCAQFSFFDDI